MAYAQLRDILDMALELQASSLGLTIDQLMTRTGRSRKTVERMLQGLSDIGLEAEPSRLESDHHLTKRWRLRANMPGTLLALQSHERGALERHLQTLPEGAATRALAKLLGDQKPLSNHLAIDAEELINRTAHIGRTGPRTQADEAQMAVFERAIQGFDKLEILYRAQGRRRASWRTSPSVGAAVRALRVSCRRTRRHYSHLPARPDRGCQAHWNRLRGAERLEHERLGRRQLRHLSRRRHPGYQTAIFRRGG